jgi:hypothetical protein
MWKWMKKLFFHLLDLLFLNRFILLTSCGSKLSHWNFGLALVRVVIQDGVGYLDHRPPHREDQPLPLASWLDLTYNKWGLAPRRKMSSAACVFCKKQTWTKFKCSKYNVGFLCWSLLQGIPHKITFLNIVWHYAGKSWMQNISTVIIPLFCW